MSTKTAPHAPSPTTPADHRLLAIALLLLGMLLFVGTDGAAKYLAAFLPSQQIIWMRYAVVVAILIPIRSTVAPGAASDRQLQESPP